MANELGNKPKSTDEDSLTSTRKDAEEDLPIIPRKHLRTISQMMADLGLLILEFVPEDNHQNGLTFKVSSQLIVDNCKVESKIFQVKKYSPSKVARIRTSMSSNSFDV